MLTEWLIHQFIKHPEDVYQKETRLSYGILSGITGIVCNVILFAVKLTVGFMIGSVSIVSDAFNNLSDSLSSVISLVGYKLSAKPADREHPFGHGRIEYLLSLTIAIFIVIVGYELFKTSFMKIIHMEETSFSLPVLIILAGTIAVKFWLSSFNGKIGKKINNSAILATAKDARNDVLATGITMIAMILSRFTQVIPFDGIGGVAVSLFILYSGFSIGRDIVTVILGRPMDEELLKQFKSEILSDSHILGMHDLMIHDYGPQVQIGSAHVEMDSALSIREAHEIIDQLEDRLMEKYNVNMTLHVDPVDTVSSEEGSYRKRLEEITAGIGPDISVHDVAVHNTEENKTLSFEITVPFGTEITAAELKEKIARAIAEDSLQISMTMQKGYTKETDHEQKEE